VSIDELEEHARRQNEVCELDFMTLVLPKKGKRPPKFPRGELLCITPDGSCVRRYSIKRVLAWCKWARAVSEAREAEAEKLGAGNG
jgi:hypothetical protein